VTTIAANLEQMSADSKVVVGDSHYPAAKIFRFPGMIVGVSGEGRAMGDFLRWVKEGLPETIPNIEEHQGSFRALVLTPDGLFEYDESFWPEKVNRNFAAIGTGAHAALAAMMLGQSTENAVAIACQIDNNTGGPVDTLKLAESKRKRK